MEVAVLTNRLTSAAFAQTTSYLLAHGRPLDQARFAYLFGDGESEEVLAALASYQNDDGGFGHGLESDLRTTASSAIATAMAGRILREVKAPADAPGIERAIAYLLNNYDTARAVWPIVTERVEDAPHAPWWTYATTAESFDGFRLNPTAELLGMLYDYRSMVPTGVLDSLTATVLERIRSAPDAMEMHDYRSCIVLAETANLPAEARAAIIAELRRRAPHTIELDQAAWDDYGLLPLGAISSPSCPLAGTIDDALVDANLDLLVARQSADGTWPITWDWSFVDQAAWRDAVQDINSRQIVENLTLLRAFDRL